MLNKHVTNFLKYYCRLSVEPEYAVLVKGPWGCGKSFLVNACVDELKKGAKPLKFLSVSLYGLSTIEEIEAKFFQQLNPFLASKGAILAGRFAKGFLRGTLKIDLDGDGNAGGSVSAGVPNINLADYLTDTSEYILVFDDLERCEIPLNNVLGFINHFVEKEGYKVIIIADEEKIIDDEKDLKQWRKIKEKLIGKTLEVEPFVSDVFDGIIKHTITSRALKKHFKENKDRILSLFNKSNHRNLRSLRKLMMEFERLFRLLDKDVQQKEGLINALLDLFIILSMEIYSGEILPNEIDNLIGNGCIARAIKDKEDPEENKYSIIEKKYETSLYETILPPSLWRDFFEKGHLNIKDTNNLLRGTPYFLEEAAPDWQKLWRVYDLEKDEFDRLYQSVKKSFDNRSFKYAGEIKHVFGMFLKFSRLGIINKTVSEVISECELYLDEAFGSQSVFVNKDTLDSINGFCSAYAGLGYCDEGTDEFKEISDQLTQKIEDAYEDSLSSRSSELLEAMINSPDKFYKMLCWTSVEQHEFQYHPILQHIKPEDFLEGLYKISNKNKRTIGHAISQRYQGMSTNHPLLAESLWIEKTYNLLNKKVQKMEVNVDKIVLEGVLGDFKNTHEKHCAIQKATN